MSFPTEKDRVKEAGLFSLICQGMQNSLLQFFREAVEALPQGQLDRADFLESLRYLRETLEETQENYQAPAPQEAENLRQAMLRCLTLYLQGLASLEHYLTDPQESRLSTALASAQGASELLEKLDRHLG